MSDPQPAVSTEQTSHGDYVPTADEFTALRSVWRRQIFEDEALRRSAVSLQVEAEAHHYTYTWEWAGVPIIRLPDDIVVLQEIFWSYRPERVVETGVARGGSVVLYNSMMRMCGLEPAVLGIDHKIYPHTSQLMDTHPLADGIRLLEAGSTSSETVAAVREFLGSAARAVLVLDSDHSHEHVLDELRMLAPLLPPGSFVLVADTLVEEFPAGHYVGRPWDKGNNPLTAVNAFLAENDDFRRDDEWGRRALTTEFRDGILRRRDR